MGSNKLLTSEQHKYLESIVEGRLCEEITEMLNKKFNLALTSRQIAVYKKNHGLKSNVDMSFKKSHEPINKGTKGLYNVGGNKTSFKKGQRPKNYKAIGTERIDRDGYTLVKVRDDGPWHERWRHKHKVVWEKAHGKIPDGYVLIFLDGNKQNIDLSNLHLITIAQNLMLNRNKWRYESAEATKVGINLANLKETISKRKQAYTSSS